MNDLVAIAIVGDFNGAFPGHVTLAPAIAHAAQKHGLDARVEWIPTRVVKKQNVTRVLDGFHSLIVAPGSPYESFDGALAAIEFGRTGARPCFGSCAGFQHVLIEYARNVLGLADAHSAEYDTDSRNVVVVPVSCPVPNRPAGAPRLSGAVECPETTIRILPGTRAAEIYKCEKVVEEYFCNYESNPAFQSRFDAAGLRLSGVGPHGEARIVEIPSHRWFLATLFQPQRATAPGRPHPIFVAYLNAVARHAREQTAKAPIAEPSVSG